MTRHDLIRGVITKITVPIAGRPLFFPRSMWLVAVSFAMGNGWRDIVVVRIVTFAFTGRLLPFLPIVFLIEEV